MIEYFRKRVLFWTATILFFSVVYTGCSGAGNIENIDGWTLKEDAEDIKAILNFRLKDNRTFYDSSGTGKIVLNLKHRPEAQIDCYGAYSIQDSANTYIPSFGYESFKLDDVARAKVIYRKNNSYSAIIGIVLFAGVIAFLFWANGERNKRP